MAGLVSYGSSDEEENLQVEAPQPLVSSSTRSSMNGISSGMFLIRSHQPSQPTTDQNIIMIFLHLQFPVQFWVQ